MDSASNIELHTGNEMPVIGFGTWKIKGSVQHAVEAALGAGYRMIDTSGDYGSQAGIGRALIENEIPRSEMYIVSKVEETDNAYEATEKNLRELEMDYVDLMLIHRPAETDEINEELWRGLIQAWQDGKVRDIGVSNFSEEQIQSLMNRTGVKPVVNQVEWSPFGWSPEMNQFCFENDIILQAYSPLTRADRLFENQITEMATEYDKTPAQIMIRWSIEHGWVPLPKSDNPAHIRENINVFDFALTETDMEALDALNEYYSVLAERPIYQLQREKSAANEAEHESSKYRQLIKSVQHYSGFSDAESKDALDGTVTTIAVHLNEGERKDFASQLPAELQDIAMSVHPTKEAAKQDLLEQFIEIQEVDEPRAIKQLLSAWQALKEAISQGEIEHILAQMPRRSATMLS